jgi:hypothetical protein
MIIERSDSGDTRTTADVGAKKPQREIEIEITY